MRSAEKTPGKAGRPRCFCEEQALDAAMRVFWQKGYEGASLTELTDAMGINRPSLYAAFGDKEALFKRALERYESGPGAYLYKALAEPKVRAVIEGLLHDAIEFLSDQSHPRGCFSVQGGLAGGEDSRTAIEVLRSRRKRGESELRKRLERARSEGDLAPDADPGDLARYIVTVLNGLGIQAVNGASKAEMMRVADMTLRMLVLP